ncbi:4,5-DOPA dioxygenase extradiol [Sphingomonas sanxanigenens]|uniref:Aromatic ring-cleaving dioxygenase n=1 Tax=Sphingomonas sanxanigenens DSM 19645 = NX02 TaxID=1123269 RepID=W0A618_9SPHN|nr:4,5-DOPA dioxygenase extradiol [Sphingomonas sanxanigenens]AHE53409.1 aromatic ring-cleaving dioxygenase [Sphingomonas sanxanigenens DSM 19645 = NX02]
MSRLPVIFFGHGSPMVALEKSAVTRTWNAIAGRVGKPKAILCISAHWLTRGTAVTAMPQPRTIHDFGAFPQALFDVQYPAPGDPELAGRVRALLSPMSVTIDQGWGLDHGTWSVLVHAYPEADVPVVQLGMDVGKSPADHWAVGRLLRPLRDEGVLIIGTGNIVHNLPAMDWGNPDAPAYPWAERFNTTMVDAIAEDRPEVVIDFAAMGEAAKLSVPTPDHFWPLLYVLGARHEGEAAEFQPNFIHHKSLSMTSVLIGA